MPEIITRRSFLRVLTGIIAAPAVIQIASLMPLRGEALIVPAKQAIIVPDASFQITGSAWTSNGGALTKWGIQRDGVWVKDPKTLDEKWLSGNWLSGVMSDA